MSDEPKVIAETEDGRITAAGRIYGRASKYDEFEEIVFPSVEMAHKLAALLADAFKRVREEISARNDNVLRKIADMGITAAQQIEAESKNRQTDLYSMRQDIGRDLDAREETFHDELRRLADRIEAVESTLGTEFNLSNRLDALADRLATVETLTSDTRTHQEELAIVCEQDIRSMGSRVDALEQDPFVEHGKRQALEERLEAVEDKLGTEFNLSNRMDDLADRLAAVERKDLVDDVPGLNESFVRLVERVSALEARQQDEAGEGAAFPRVSAVRDDARKELAREIVERLRRAEIPGGCSECGWVDNVANPVADWIEREFGGD